MVITYCIVCNITGEKYYGSTIRTLEKRMYLHKCKSNDCCSRQIIERNDYDSYILGEYETKEEAELKEDWYIRNKKCINKQRVKVTEEEKKEYIKEYRQEKKEQIIEKKKKYYQKNCEQIKEKQKKYQKNYREKNREKNREKVNCEFCKKQMCRDSLTRHKKLLHFDAILADKDID